MDTSPQAAVVPKDRDSWVALKRQRRSIAEKRRIVEETLVEGASVARVARAHGVNANQVFYWRKLYQSGRLGTTSIARLLPVRVTRESSPPPTISLPDIESSDRKRTSTPSNATIRSVFSADCHFWLISSDDQAARSVIFRLARPSSRYRQVEWVENR